MISNAVLGGGLGNTGDVLINTGSLTLNNNAQINTIVFELAEGNAGLVKINASRNVEINENSGVISSIDSGVVGNATGVEINAGSLLVNNGSRIDSRNTGTGNAGTIFIDVDGSVTVSDSILLSDKDSSTIGNSGDIKILGQSISLTNSQLFSDNTGMGNTGIISIEVDNSVVISNSRIINNIGSFSGVRAVGKVGMINIKAQSISLTDGTELQAGVFSGSEGKEAGLISLQATDSISLTNTNLFTDVSVGGLGNGGNVAITVDNGSVYLDNSNIFTSTSSLDNVSGDISIVANSLTMINNSDLGSFGQGSGAGNATIITNEFVTLDNNSNISVFAGESTVGGNVYLETGTLKILNGSDILGSTFSDQPAGNLVINASELVEISGSIEDILGNFSGSSLAMSTLGGGDAGDITINTKKLIVQNGATITTQALTQEAGKRNGGSIKINASDSVEVQGTTPNFLSISRISSDTAGEGKAGDIRIDTGKLIVSDGATVSSFAKLGSSGQGGTIEIYADESVEILGTRPPLNFFPTTLDTGSGGTGKAGDIKIVTGNLIVRDGAKINTSASDSGQGGNIDIMATESVKIIGTSSSFSVVISKLGSETFGSGNAGNITINTPQLTISEGAGIEAFTQGEGTAGNITINAPDSIILNSDTKLIVETSDAGTAGSININTPLLTIGENAQLSATATATSTAPTAGNINLNVNQLNISGELGIFAETNSTPTAGSLTIHPYENNPNLNIQFTENGFISARTTNIGDGGSISLTAPENIDISGLGSITAETSGIGNAGNINITTENLTIRDGVEIRANTSSVGDSGNIVLSILNLNLDNATIEALTTNQGNPGSILISNGENQANQVNIANNSTISTEIRGEGNPETAQPANITINSENLSLISSQILPSHSRNIHLD